MTDHIALANQYIEGVLSGDILACKWVRLACQRQRDDLARAEAGWAYRFDVARAARICKFVENFHHTKGEWAAKKQNIRLEPWQCFILTTVFGWVRVDNGKRRFRKATTVVPRKNGKALALDTPVPTPDGWRTMGDLVVGDKVFGPDGTVRTIVAATDVMYDRPCYEVIMVDGERIVADAEHLWLTDSRRDRDRLAGRNKKAAGPKPSVKTTVEIAQTLMCRDELNHRIHVASPIDGVPDRDYLIDPYMLGLWLGDGTSAAAKLTVGDKDIVETGTNVLACGEVLSKRSGKCAYVIGTGSRSKVDRDASFQARLRKIGVLNDKHVPDDYMLGSRRQRMALFQGLMDSDGYVSKSGQCEFTNTNKRLVDAVCELAWGLGIKPTVRLVDARLNGRIIGDAWKVTFFAFSDDPPFRLSRHVTRLKPNPGRLVRSKTRQIAAVNPVPSVPVRCIQVDHPDGMFLVGRSYLPTHNSALSAPVGLYMLSADGEHGAEVYCGATSEKQAWEVFRPAKLMAQQNPAFLKHFGVQVNASNINVLKNASRFEPLIGKPGDGSSPHMAILDEYHEHQTPDAHDTMLTGMGARTQPLIWVITTAGDNLAGPCYDDILTLRKVLDSVVVNDELFGIEYTIDEDDDWQSEEALRKANPNFDVSVSGDFLRSRQRDAIENARNQGIFKTKHLNLWVSSRSAFFNMQKWTQCADSSLELDDFEGQDCYLSLDLASKVDISAKIMLFPRDDGKFVVFGTYYLPEGTVERTANNHYRGWVDGGQMVATDGDMIDMDRIEQDILDDCRRFNVREVVYDPFQATMLVTHLQNEGIECVEYRAVVSMMSDPMKTLDGLIMSNKIVHNGDPVLTWMMSNVVARADNKDNVYPVKERAENKIDGAVALIMAMGRANTPDADGGPSVYEQRELFVL